MNVRFSVTTASLALLAVAQVGLAQQWGMTPVVGYGHPGAPQVAIAPQYGYWQPIAYNPQEAASEGSLLGNENYLSSEEASCGACGCDAGCVDGQCGEVCDCQTCGCGCGPKLMVFADYLYLRPRDKELAYVVPINGDIDTPLRDYPLQIGAVGVLDPKYKSGFRVGFAGWMNDSAAIGAQYTWFASHTEDSAAQDVGSVLRSLVRHPGWAAAATDFARAEASYDVDFQIVDLDYRITLLSTLQHELTFIGGLCYAHEKQDFFSRFENGGVEFTQTDIVFDGGGIRLGLEGERHSVRTGLMAYGRTSARFVAGEFRSTYFYGTGTDPVVADTRWTAGRAVTILDLELGIGWVSKKGCCRVNAGWMFSGWLNTVNTDEWIKAVQSNNFVGLSDNLAFDGLVTRAEVRW